MQYSVEIVEHNTLVVEVEANSLEEAEAAAWEALERDGRVDYVDETSATVETITDDLGNSYQWSSRHSEWQKA